MRNKMKWLSVVAVALCVPLLCFACAPAQEGPPAADDDPPPAAQVVFTADKTEYTISEGEKVKLSFSLTDDGTLITDETTPEYSSSDTSIATVNVFGTVTGVKSGSCVITAEYK